MDAEGQLELGGTPPLGFEARKRNLHLAPLAELKEFRGNTNLDLIMPALTVARAQPHPQKTP